MYSCKHKFEHVHQFELNVPYTRCDTAITFVRRTAKCLFDDTGRKYVVGVCQTDDTWTVGVEYVQPWGPFKGHFFANKI